jgi:hypothetical protein
MHENSHALILWGVQRQNSTIAMHKYGMMEGNRTQCEHKHAKNMHRASVAAPKATFALVTTARYCIAPIMEIYHWCSSLDNGAATVWIIQLQIATVSQFSAICFTELFLFFLLALSSGSGTGPNWEYFHHLIKWDVVSGTGFFLTKPILNDCDHELLQPFNCFLLFISLDRHAQHS